MLLTSISHAISYLFFIVIILICTSEDAKIILLAAEELGLNTGDFIFIVLQQWEVRAHYPFVAHVVRGESLVICFEIEPVH